MLRYVFVVDKAVFKRINHKETIILSIQIDQWFNLMKCNIRNISKVSYLFKK